MVFQIYLWPCVLMLDRSEISDEEGTNRIDRVTKLFKCDLFIPSKISDRFLASRLTRNIQHCEHSDILEILF